MATTRGIEKRGFDAPDETRPAGSGEARIVNLGDVAIMQITLPPGWGWSKDAEPIAGTESCQAPHLAYHVAGRLRVRHDDGAEEEFGPGDLGRTAPGHDAWVVGDEPAVMLDITGAGPWAKPS
jgi:hypothetical protein